ncbi:MAG TPA: ATP-dependent helicase HrpB [Cyclobacteriaceae bacterium]|nr:ATP-dependent helicase HrpB [Cyclobacteriaceae bacterium]
MSYPILAIVEDIKNALRHSSTVVLQAPPGAGKSTVLPLQLLGESWLKGQKIIMLEPRRLATRSVAHRMSALHKEEVGQTIGYRIRFDSVVSKMTRIEVVTEGILTRMIQQDNALAGVGLVIFDEFHERSLHADLALALCRQLQQVLRDDLKILVMSATIDGRKLSESFGGAPVITSEGKSFPVSLYYVNPDSDVPITLRVARTVRTAIREQPGDILVFLPGAGEIKKVATLVEREVGDALILPLYGDLSFKAQEEAILPHPTGRRKIVLATSIAETSLTIEGITTVVDSGLSRIPRYDPRSGLTRLETVPVTADAADQRAGRAGRLGPGVCYRLWSQGMQQFLVPHRQPEILEADLTPLILELANVGIADPGELQWITAPPKGAVLQAKELLDELGATHNDKITDRGKEMARLPTHPRLAHMLIKVIHDKRLLSLAVDCAAVLEERDPLATESSADITLRLDLLRKFRQNQAKGMDRFVLDRIDRLVKNWCKIFGVEADNSLVNHYEAGMIIAYAYPDRIAQQTEKNSERYKLSGGRIVRLAQNDGLINDEFLAVAHLDGGTREGRIFLAAPLDKRDIDHLAREIEIVKWDSETNRIAASLEKKIGPLTLSKKTLRAIPEKKRLEVLFSVIRQNGLSFIGWNEEHQLWQARIMSLRSWRPNEPWPDVSDENLLDTIETWLSPFLMNVNKKAELQNLNLSEILSSLLPWPLLDKLDVLVPLRIKVPSDSWIKVKYFPDGRSPVMEVRLQEVFGLLETPRINEGQTPVLMYLLSPGFRPVQVTQDLHSFWSSTYAEVRKELRMRYPKHHWPEDPWTAQAVRGVKRKS